MRKQYTPTIKAKIVTELLKEEKTLAQLSSEYGVSTKQLTRWKNHTLAELPRLFETKNDQSQEKYETKINELYAEIGRLPPRSTGSKKNLASTLSRTERRALIEWEGRVLSLKKQAELLSLSWASLYYQPVLGHKIYPYLLQNVFASYPNHIWDIDITYIRLQQGWMYLVAILD